MAAQLVLVEKSETKFGQRTLEHMRAALVVMDTATYTSQALQIAQAETVLQAAGLDIPDGYFDTARAASVWGTAGDYTCFDGKNFAEAIA